jgi:hypothetical protein
MTSVYATHRMPPGVWSEMTRQQRDELWARLAASCAARAASQGLTCTSATKIIEEELVRRVGDETGWETVTTAIATDVTVHCDTTRTTDTARVNA